MKKEIKDLAGMIANGIQYYVDSFESFFSLIPVKLLIIEPGESIREIEVSEPLNWITQRETKR